MARSTLTRVPAETPSIPRTTFDTVDFETPANAATSKIVGSRVAACPAPPRRAFVRARRALPLECSTRGLYSADAT